ncbi:MAG: hypothetical protein NVSMB64_10800 [Candidatus Velthaea sp.]
MSSTAKPAKAPAPEVLFICQKCDGGKALRRTLKAAIKESGRKRAVRVVASGCLDVCPKQGVTVARASTGRPATYAVFRAGAALDDILGP